MADLLQAELLVLRKENEQLADRVAELEEILLPSKLDYGMSLGLTKQESLVLTRLIRGRGQVVSKDAIFSWVYAFRTGEKEPEIKIVDVFVHKLRKKLAQYGVVVDTIWGQGYRIDRSNLDILLAVKGYCYAELENMLKG